MRICRKCKEPKPIEDFAADAIKKDGLATCCKKCNAERYQVWRQSNQAKVRERDWRVQGICFTWDEYNEMFIQQGGCCATCGTHQSELKKALYVDHCHDTGRVRGLLCHKCNTALGHSDDNPALLRRLADYLEDNN